MSISYTRVLFYYRSSACVFIFFFNAPATPEIYTLSLHDALPISRKPRDAAPAAHPRERSPRRRHARALRRGGVQDAEMLDRKSTRLNSSHANISYAVFCLKKKKNKNIQQQCNHNCYQLRVNFWTM